MTSSPSSVREGRVLVVADSRLDPRCDPAAVALVGHSRPGRASAGECAKYWARFRWPRVLRSIPIDSICARSRRWPIIRRGP